MSYPNEQPMRNQLYDSETKLSSLTLCFFSLSLFVCPSIHIGHTYIYALSSHLSCENPFWCVNKEEPLSLSLSALSLMTIIVDKKEKLTRKSIEILFQWFLFTSNIFSPPCSFLFFVCVSMSEMNEMSRSFFLFLYIKIILITIQRK